MLHTIFCALPPAVAVKFSVVETLRILLHFDVRLPIEPQGEIGELRHTDLEGEHETSRIGTLANSSHVERFNRRRP